MAKYGTETQYAIWNSKKAIALQYQKDATRAYMAYLEVQKLTGLLECRAPKSTQGEDALNAVFLLFDRYYRLYIAACNDVNACIGRYGLVDAVYTSLFDFHSLAL
jgi:hypothetical protein